MIECVTEWMNALHVTGEHCAGVTNSDPLPLPVHITIRRALTVFDISLDCVTAAIDEWMRMEDWRINADDEDTRFPEPICPPQIPHVKKLKVACGAFSALQPVGRLYPCPQWVPLINLQRRHAQHRHERPLPAKEGTIQGILLAHSYFTEVLGSFTCRKAGTWDFFGTAACRPIVTLPQVSSPHSSPEAPRTT